jgi:3-carboxy-cis,cis-muconate cycloisomerase
MTATATDSMVLGNLFGSEAMRGVFSDESRLQRYLDVEAALAAVQARLGIIPLAAVAEIERHCSVRDLDLARLIGQTERFGDLVPAVVEQVIEKCPGDLGQHVHWGATTQDISDTATILQIRQALALVDDDLQAIAASLAELARRYRDAPMAGRSNLQQAVPITLAPQASSSIGFWQSLRKGRSHKLHVLRAARLSTGFWAGPSVSPPFEGQGFAAEPVRCSTS